jgi:hypothetical protein
VPPLGFGMRRCQGRLSTKSSPLTRKPPFRAQGHNTTPPDITRPRLLIVSGNLALLRGHYEGVIAALVRRGVQVSIRYRRDSGLSAEEYRATLRDAGIVAEVAALPNPPRRAADVFGVGLRELGNILRFAHPDYAGRDRLNERAYEKKGQGARRWGRRILRLGPRPALAAGRFVSWIEATLPAPRYAVDLLAEEHATAVAVAPVIRTPVLVDFLKAGAQLRVATAIWVQSWDNLTNKGLLHFSPDRVFVWNERQKAELDRYHGVDGDRVCVTGAQTFDHWFSDAAPVSRAEFCARMGIDVNAPIVLYLSSSKQIAPEEPTFFASWLEAVRSSDEQRLRSATILVRPHPTMVEAWYASGVDREPDVVLSPATRKDQLNSAAFREQYRAELHHATLAFGVNTSGLIDAAIFGKPTLTVEVPELFHGQRGTVHFEHLARSEGGLLRTSSALKEHVEELAELIQRDPYAADERSREFVGAFVRPHGLESRPTEVFAEEMDALCRTLTTVSPPTGVRRAFGLTLSVAAPFASARARRRLYKRSRHAPLALARRVLPARVRHLLRRALTSSASRRGRTRLAESEGGEHL